MGLTNAWPSSGFHHTRDAFSLVHAMSAFVMELLPEVSADGPRQMAADEVMLERAIAGQASLRFYTWSPPTVSLGYFQKHAERLADAQLAAYPWVRRCTGGGAIIHDRDLTYAFALPAGARTHESPQGTHNRFHEALAKVLSAWRISAAVKVGPRRRQEELGFRCFAVPQPGDVVLGEQKIIGGAQRVRQGALLQHGSIQVPELIPGAARLAERLADVLGWKLNPTGWSTQDRQRIDELARTRYSQPAWNCKR